jgi:hypothetical protein
VRSAVSACLIVRNEEHQLADALASLAFCDELVVVDSGSTDRTVQVARAGGATVVESAWRGFGAQRNVAIDHAHGEWVLEVDADERITPELARSIRGFVDDGASAAYDIAVLPMHEVFLGRALRPAIKYPRYRARLFRRGAYRHDEARRVHEGIWVSGPARALRGDMVHLLASGWREALDDAWRYARLQAEQTAPLPSPAAYARAIIARPVAKLGYRLVVDGGWRDGWQGVAKIALDCASDAAVWTLHATGRARPAGAAAPATRHFGHQEAPAGPVRLVAVTAGARETARAVEWLRAARAAGADCGLIADVPPAPADAAWLDPLGCRPIRPISLLRALDMEVQRRPPDALVAGRTVPRRLLARLPAQLRGRVAPASLDEDPAAAEARVRAAARSGGAA